MPESTETISCPECSIPFDTRDELERHSRHQHAITSKEEKAHMPSIEERIQSRTEEKGKGETAESTER